MEFAMQLCVESIGHSEPAYWEAPTQAEANGRGWWKRLGSSFRLG